MNKTLLAAALVVMGGAALFAGDVVRFRGDNSQGMYLEANKRNLINITAPFFHPFVFGLFYNTIK